MTVRRALRRYGAVGICVAVALSWSHSALADRNKCDPKWERMGMCNNDTPMEVDVDAEARARAEAEARSRSESQSDARSEATGGAAEAHGYGGDSSGQATSVSNESAYIAVQRNLPQAVGCFGPVDGGGGEGGGFAFFGWTPLNKDCWSQEVSAGYQDHMIKSRLECGSKWFRNAIGFEIRRRDRQRYCVDWMEERYVAGVEYARRQLDLLEAQRAYDDALHNTKEKLKACRDESDLLVHKLGVSEEATRRATEAWHECLRK